MDDWARSLSAEIWSRPMRPILEETEAAEDLYEGGCTRAWLNFLAPRILAHRSYVGMVKREHYL